jgi:acyl carrier protein
MTQDTLTALSAYISDTILKQPGKAIDPNAKLISSGVIDSFSLVDLAMFIEDSFGVQIADTELNAQTFDTLAQLTALVDQRNK